MAAPFRVPDMSKLTCTIWRTYGPPFLPRPGGGIDSPCNLSTSRPQQQIGADFGLGATPALLLPARTDIRPTYGFGDGATGGDTVECPKLSGRFYVVLGVEDVARGYDNEYRLALLQQQPFPTTRPVP